MDAPLPVPEADPSRCKLLGQTALIVQGLMGVFVLASLVAKRQLEKRKRKWKIWVWDVSKQLVGQAVVHGLNLLISDLVAHAADNNPCSLYFLNVLIDTTLGVGIFYLALKGFTWLFSVRLAIEGYMSGHYGSPARPLFWWRQLLPYILSIITMKLLVLLPLTLPGISALLLRFGHALLDYLSPSVQVVFVMAIFPLVMNVIQFCLVDQVIKGGGKHDDIKEDDEDEGYERLPGDDVEAAPRTLRQNSTKSSLVRRHSGSGPPTPVQSSPLLEAVDDPSKVYGSTSPLPRLRSLTEEGARERRLPPDLVLDGATIDLTSPPPSTIFASISRLSEDIGREARRSLSPTTRLPRVASESSVGLHVMKR